MKNGSLEVITGGMFAGKSEELIRRLRRHIFAKQQVIVFKSKLDTRYNPKSIVTHNNSCLDAIAIQDISDFYIPEIKTRLDTSQIVGFDEVQFFPYQIVEFILELRRRGKIIIASGLDLDYKIEPFEVTKELLSHANKINKYHAVCVKCFNEALFSYRLTKEKRQILVGGLNDYLPLCEQCYLKAMTDIDFCQNLSYNK